MKPSTFWLFLTGNRRSFLFVEGSTTSRCDCHCFLSPLFEAENRFDRIAIYYQDTVKCTDLIFRQTFEYAIPISFAKSPQNDISLEIVNDENYLILPQPAKRATPIFFEPKQLQFGFMCSTKFTAQEAGIYKTAEINKILKSYFLQKTFHYYTETFGKSKNNRLFSHSSKNPTDSHMIGSDLLPTNF